MVSLKQLFEWFTTGKFPTEAQFAEQFKSFWHKSERIPQTQVLGLNEALDDKATKKELANATTNNKGIFSTDALLKSAYPPATNRKDFYAFIGTQNPFRKWEVRADAGQWIDTGQDMDIADIDLAEYATITNLEGNKVVYAPGGRISKVLDFGIGTKVLNPVNPTKNNAPGTISYNATTNVATFAPSDKLNLIGYTSLDNAQYGQIVVLAQAHIQWVIGLDNDNNSYLIDPTENLTIMRISSGGKQVAAWNISAANFTKTSPKRYIMVGDTIKIYSLEDGEYALLYTLNAADYGITRPAFGANDHGLWNSRTSIILNNVTRSFAKNSGWSIERNTMPMAINGGSLVITDEYPYIGNAGYTGRIFDVSRESGNFDLTLEKSLPLIDENYRSANMFISVTESLPINSGWSEWKPIPDIYLKKNTNFSPDGVLSPNNDLDCVAAMPISQNKLVKFRADHSWVGVIHLHAGLKRVRHYTTDDGIEHQVDRRGQEDHVYLFTRGSEYATGVPGGINITNSIQYSELVASEFVYNNKLYQYSGLSLNDSDFLDVKNWREIGGEYSGNSNNTESTDHSKYAVLDGSTPDNESEAKFYQIWVDGDQCKTKIPKTFKDRIFLDDEPFALKGLELTANNNVNLVYQQEASIIEVNGEIRVYFTGVQANNVAVINNNICYCVIDPLSGEILKESVWVIGHGRGGAPINRQANCSHVFKYGGKIYCVATDGYGTYKSEVYLYVSNDGINFTQLSQLSNSTTNWYAYGNNWIVPEPIGGKFYWFYEGRNTGQVWQSAIATADKIDGPYTKLGGISIPNGGNNGMLGGMCVYLHENKFRMFYHYGKSGGDLPTVIGYAESDVSNPLAFEGKNLPLLDFTRTPWGANTDQIADPAIYEINGSLYFIAEYCMNYPSFKAHLYLWVSKGMTLNKLFSS